THAKHCWRSRTWSLARFQPWSKNGKKACYRDRTHATTLLTPYRSPLCALPPKVAYASSLYPQRTGAGTTSYKQDAYATLLAPHRRPEKRYPVNQGGIASS